MPATTPRPPSSEQVAAFDRNAWSRSIGIPGRNPRNPHSNEYRTYFTDGGIRQTLARHGLSLIEGRNLNAYRKAGVGATIAAALCRLPLGSAVLDRLPERYVYQRCYVARCAAPQ